MNAQETKVSQYFQVSSVLLSDVAVDGSFIAEVAAAASLIVAAVRNGGKILIAGNGGSAADAQHMAGEFLSRFSMDRDPMAAIALTVDTSVLTAVGNDYAFDQIFARQVFGLGRGGDVFIAISTSGKSANILAALMAAKVRGLRTIGLSGECGGHMKEMCDCLIAVPSARTSLIQQVHIVAYHAICGLVERELFEPKSG